MTSPTRPMAWESEEMMEMAWARGTHDAWSFSIRSLRSEKYNGKG